MEKETLWRLLLFCGGTLIGLSLFFGLYFGLPPQTVTVNDEVVDIALPLYGEFESAAVATDAGPCSVIGKDFLERGGSIVDAAVGAMLCVGLHNAHSTGIGGGSFMNIYDAASGENVFINSREVAPLDAYENMFEGDSDRSSIGASSIAVPGEIAGYWEAHQRYGKLPWKELFLPTINLAAYGYRINSALAKAIDDKPRIMEPEYNLAPIFVHAVNGSRKREGELVTSPSLANTLRIIAEEGPSAFYNGSLTSSILADLRDAAGYASLIREEDLTTYKVEVKSTINITLGDLTVLTPGSPSGGPVLSYILNILKGYKFTPDDVATTEAKVLTYHRIIEAFKFAYARRTQLGDENFDDNVTKIVNQLVDDDYAEQTRAKIVDEQTQPVEYYGADFLPPPDDAGTSHLCIVGADGSAISMTSTINGRFGSYVRGLRTGILFNNEMDDFSSPNITNIFDVPPSPANFIQPKKRPLSSMSPAILIDRTKSGKDAVQILSGASGGTKITTGTAWTIMQMIWFGLRVDEAVNLKRLHHQLVPEKVQFQEGFDQSVMDGLKAKGHAVDYYDPPGSVVQAIQVQANGFLGAMSDGRKSGYSDGY